MRPKRTLKDGNHEEIRDGLRALGAVVWDTADLGGEVFDLVVSWRGRTVPVEVKLPGREWQLTDDQCKSIVELYRVGVYPIVATCVEDVVNKFS